MTATVTDFHYGAVTPVAAYLMACLGSALGLRCTVRSLRRGPRPRRSGWLTLGAVCLGCGIWTMHFIAMMGFSIDGAVIQYDTPLTLLSLAVAIVVTALGVFLVGRLGAKAPVLSAAGLLTGLGIAAMHYLGMAALRVHGTIRYDALTVTLSVLIAVVAATAALWAAVTIRNLWSSLGASIVMGIAVTGMHYTGMAAVSVHLDRTAAVGAPQSAVSLLSFLLAMIAGPVIALVLAAAIVMFDPDLVLGDTDTDIGTVPERAPRTQTRDTAPYGTYRTPAIPAPAPPRPPAPAPAPAPAPQPQPQYGGHGPGQTPGQAYGQDQSYGPARPAPDDSWPSRH